MAINRIKAACCVRRGRSEAHPPPRLISSVPANTTVTAHWSNASPHDTTPPPEAVATFDLKRNAVFAWNLPFPSGSVLMKIIKNKSQGATPEHRTLPLPNFARYDATTSHPATLSYHTLRHRAIAPCHFHTSHLATQKTHFWTQNQAYHPDKSNIPDISANV